MQMLNEIRRVTGWHTLFDHEAFFLLLAAMSSTTILWFYPGIGRIHAAYFPQDARPAAVYMSQRVAPEVEVVDGAGQTVEDGNMMVSGTPEQI
jgi:hypothetical protein